jgi:hypothetical protein
MNWSIGGFVYGATEGTVTTSAMVAGVIGTSISPSIVLILGFANLLSVQLEELMLKIHLH